MIQFTYRSVTDRSVRENTLKIIEYLLHVIEESKHGAPSYRKLEIFLLPPKMHEIHFFSWKCISQHKNQLFSFNFIDLTYMLQIHFQREKKLKFFIQTFISIEITFFFKYFWLILFSTIVDMVIILLNVLLLFLLFFPFVYFNFQCLEIDS